MNQEQLLSLVRTLLAAGGPISGLLVMYGMSQDKATMWLGLALVIAPPLASAIWGIVSKTDKSRVAAVGAMAGVTVSVTQDASDGAQAAAADPKVPGVNPT